MDVIRCDPGHTEDARCGVLPGYRRDGSIIVKGVTARLGDTSDHAHNVDGALAQVTGALGRGDNNGGGAVRVDAANQHMEWVGDPAWGWDNLHCGAVFLIRFWVFAGL